MAGHLTIEEREVISQMRYGGRTVRGMGRRLGRRRSTIYRELARNRDRRGYSAVRAQRQADERRRKRPLVRRMDRPMIRSKVCQGLLNYWSPEQIAGGMRRRRPGRSQKLVSHETIYQWIREQSDRRYWQAFLRFGGRRRRPLGHDIFGCDAAHSTFPIRENDKPLQNPSIFSAEWEFLAECNRLGR